MAKSDLPLSANTDIEEVHDSALDLRIAQKDEFLATEAKRLLHVSIKPAT